MKRKLISHWDRYLGMMTAITQVPVPSMTTMTTYLAIILLVLFVRHLLFAD